MSNMTASLYARLKQQSTPANFHFSSGHFLFPFKVRVIGSRLYFGDIFLTLMAKHHFRPYSSKPLDNYYYIETYYHTNINPLSPNSD